MPTPTYDLIASNVLTSSASSVTFSSIPATYRDLVLVMDAQHTDSVNFRSITMQVNSDTGSNYSWVDMRGNGSTTASSNDTPTTRFNFAGDAYRNTSKVLIVVQLMDYAATDKHKTVLGRLNKANELVSAMAGRWANTAAINAIEVQCPVNIASGSSFYLYGIVS